ncbi:hypothetical protein CF328_g6161, partial [Tilletia controversa]
LAFIPLLWNTNRPRRQETAGRSRLSYCPPASSTHVHTLVTDMNADPQLGLFTHTPSWGGTPTFVGHHHGTHGLPALRTFALVRRTSTTLS